MRRAGHRQVRTEASTKRLQIRAAIAALAASASMPWSLRALEDQARRPGDGCGRVHGRRGDVVELASAGSKNGSYITGRPLIRPIVIAALASFFRAATSRRRSLFGSSAMGSTVFATLRRRAASLDQKRSGA